MPANPAPIIATFSFGPLYISGSGGNKPLGALTPISDTWVSREQRAVEEIHLVLSRKRSAKAVAAITQVAEEETIEKIKRKREVGNELFNFTIYTSLENLPTAMAIGQP